VDDVSNDGMRLVEDIVHIYDNYEFETQVLAASLRHPQHVVEAALAGAHVGTLPLGVMQLLFNHPLTDVGLQKFMDDWKKVPQT
jgi:transaldolase